VRELIACAATLDHTLAARPQPEGVLVTRKRNHFRSRRWRAVLIVATLLAGAAAVAPATGASAATDPNPQCPWLNPALPVTQRVDMLVSSMTLEQQASLMQLHQNTAPLTEYQVYTNPIPEVCVPAITEGDGPDMVRKELTGATAFPAPITLAATFDPSLANAFGDALGSEFQGKGVMMAHAPNSNLARVPQWGRNFETFGEDPYLDTMLSDPEIDGIQSNGVIDDVKHIAEYQQESGEHPPFTRIPQVNVVVDQRTMMETELSVFESAFKDAGALAGMCSFTEINGVPACQNPAIMSWLRNDVGFQGMIRSDRPTSITDLPKAVSLGMDQSFDISATTILNDVAAGLISPDEIATAAKQILLPVFQAGIMDKPWNYTPDANVSTAAHQQTALTIAERGAVLLRNQSNVLPLNTNAVKSIAVIGADASTNVLSNSPAATTVTPLQAITDRAGSGVSVNYVEGDHAGDATADAASIQAAADAARSADVAVVFVGVGGSEGSDLTSATLSGDGKKTDQDQLIEAVAAANPRTVVVLNTANPVLMPWNSQVAGIVEAWRPGQVDGTAIAHVLFGDVNPSGKLPMTFPASADQSLTADPSRYPGVDGTETYSEGLDIGYKWFDANAYTPLYPFGYGLSYTNFAFSNIKMTPGAAVVHGPAADPNTNPNEVVAQVQATVQNTGIRAGTDVAQLYLTDPASANEPVRQLRGFKPVNLAPGAQTTVTFPLTARDLAYWNSSTQKWAVPAGDFGIHVGDSSALTDLPLTGTLNLAPACTRTITGTNNGPLSVSSGVLCLDGATVNGPINITSGASLLAVGASIHGPVSAANANTVWLSGGQVSGALSVTHTTGTVIVDGTAIKGPLSLSSNMPRSTTPLVSANTINGPLSCAGNSPAPANGGQANSVSGPKSGQCQHL
jgi:beta-glucosidase